MHARAPYTQRSLGKHADQAGDVGTLCREAVGRGRRSAQECEC